MTLEQECRDRLAAEKYGNDACVTESGARAAARGFLSGRKDERKRSQVLFEALQAISAGAVNHQSVARRAITDYLAAFV